ncbi:MAG: pirin family protein, partial [Pseudomonadota bacterium]
MSDSPETPSSPRTVVRSVRGLPATDGAGVNLNRLIGTQQLGDLDPFLMLDEFRSDDPNAYIAGFPNHPHRGFETVTYMLAGRMRHGDNQGNSGLLTAGSLQWMTAGRGIVHSEMPEQEDGLMWGFQLWINLPAAQKMTPPAYQDIAPEKIPAVNLGSGAIIKVLAGRFGDLAGAAHSASTDPLYLDISLPAETDVDVPVAHGHTAFAYVYDGTVAI